MSVSATESAIDVAYWFFGRAEKDGIFLDDEKMFHLLFIAQLNYARRYEREVLVPSFFVCDEDGFSEPNLKKMFSLGRPYMPPVKLSDKVCAFLEAIWKQYAQMTTAAFSSLIKNSSAYKECYRNGEKRLVAVDDILDKFTLPWPSESSGENKKIRISQNGPVMVSRWNPRKLESSEQRTKNK